MQTLSYIFEGLKFYLGLFFDGLDKFNDLRDSKPDIAQLTVVPDPPSFHGWDGIQSVKAGSILLIKVGTVKHISLVTLDQTTTLLICIMILFIESPQAIYIFKVLQHH